MNVTKILSHISSITFICVLTGCGYSSLYNPDQPKIQSFYNSLNESKAEILAKNKPAQPSITTKKKNHKTKHKTTHKKKASYNYYQEFIDSYKGNKLINKPVAHSVGDNQFNKKYKNGILNHLTLDPTKNSTILASESIWVASITNYNGWFLRAELNKLLHTVAPIGNYAYVLKVTLRDGTTAFSSDIYGVPNRFKYVLKASYSIEDFTTGKVIYNSVSQAVTNYTLSRSLTALTFAEKDAKEKALTYISTKIYTNIVAWLYHNEHQIAIMKPKILKSHPKTTPPPTKTIKDTILYPLPTKTKPKKANNHTNNPPVDQVQKPLKK